MRGMHAAPVTRALTSKITKRLGKATYAVVTAVAMLITLVGFTFTTGSAQADSAKKPDRVTICHSTGADMNPYVSNQPDKSADVGGHAAHTGPIWPSKDASGNWGDIIPPFDYDDGGVTKHYPGSNWTAEGQAIFNNGCGIPTTVTPADPAVAQARCVGGAAVAPSITVAAGPAGVSYSLNPAAYVAGDTVTVTAVANASAWFQAPAPAGWTFVDLKTETFTVQLVAAPGCAAAKTPLAPQDPAVTQSACSAGVATAPTVSVAGAPTGVSYSVPAGPYTAGTTVTVTATITDPAQYEFSGAPPAGWVYDTASSAHFDVVFAAAPTVCPVVKSILAPDDPTWTEATCTRGTAIDPTLTPATTADITYAVKPAGVSKAGDTVVVTATIDKPALDRFDAASMPAPWVYVSDTEATFTLTFKAAPACGGVPGPSTIVPQSPDVAQSVCLGPGVTDPTLSLPVTPAGVSYRATPAVGYKPGDTVTVTATIDNAAANEFTSATLPAGWTWVSATEASYTVTFDAAPSCSGVGGLHAVAVPDPTFTDPGCTAGKPIGGSYTIVAMDHVSYTVGGKVAGAGIYPAVGGSTVTITAHADTGYTLVGGPAYTHTFKADPEACLGVLPQTAGPAGPLANTGAGPVTAELGWVAGLLIVGAAALFAGRRRRPEEA